VEELERFQWLILPSSVKSASYELHHIGPNIIPFEKKECVLGEMFSPFYFENISA
jgi:hypothetical protein